MVDPGGLAHGAAGPQTTINDLEITCMTLIFGHLNAKECTVAGGTQRYWQQVANDELLWRKYLDVDWALQEPLGPNWGSFPTFQAAYRAWLRAFPDPAIRPYVRRASRAWRAIKAWLAQHLPTAAASLQPGVSAEAVSQAEVELGCALPPALKAIYMLHDGQALRNDAELDVKQDMPGAAEALTAVKARDAALAAAANPGAEVAEGPEGDHNTLKAAVFAGMFGGYCYYDNLVVTRMLPLARAVFWTRLLHGRGKPQCGPGRLVVAASFNFAKIFVADLADGSISVVDAAGALVPAAVPAAPPAAPPAVAAGLSAAAGAGEAGSGTAWAGTSGPQAARVSGGGGGPGAEEPAGADEVGGSGSRAVAGGGASGSTAGGTSSSTAGGTSGSTVGCTAGGTSEERDGVLRWLEEYGRRLEGGWYEVSALDEELGPEARAINLFSLRPPVMATEVTRGVRVRATSLFVPEGSRASRNLFTYSIRFSMLDPDEQIAHWPATAGKARALSSAQLMSRHWVIRNAVGEVVDEVRGEAVIGKYPLLTPGAPEFVYQSCTQQVGRLGHMEGDFRFVEGSIQRPSGGEWDVVCPRFTLAVPDYIY